MTNINQIIRSHPALHNMRLLLRQHIHKLIKDDEYIVRREFRMKIGREMNIVSPQTFNDKLQWLRFNWYDELAILCSDKYLVREHVSNTIEVDILNELYGVYASVDDIDIHELPDAFVLKANHGSGWNIICTEKPALNWKVARSRLKTWMKMNYYWEHREWQYRDIQPKILCEKLLSEPDGTPPIEYKIFCFNGEPRFTYVCLERETELKADYYDIDWNKQPIRKHYEMSNRVLPKPHNYELMLDISRKLAEPFPFVRVDLYEIDNRVIFSELTFSPGNGMDELIPEKYDWIIGDLLEI